MADIPSDVKSYVDARESELWTRVNNQALEPIDALRRQIIEVWTNVNNQVLVPLNQLQNDVAAVLQTLNIQAVPLPTLPPSGVKIADRTITQFGGPETRVECVDTIDLGPLGKHCKEYKTTFMQHQYLLEMWGPPGLDSAVADRISNSCFAAAVGGAIAGLVLTPLDIASKLAAAAAAAEVVLRTCIETQNLLGKVAVKDFSVHVTRRDFW